MSIVRNEIHKKYDDFYRIVGARPSCLYLGHETHKILLNELRGGSVCIPSNCRDRAECLGMKIYIVDECHHVEVS